MAQTFNNIGCIYLKIGQYMKSHDYLLQAIILGCSDSEKLTSEFILACRCYNRALAIFMHIMSQIEEHFQYNSLSHFVQNIPRKENSDRKSRTKAHLQTAVLAALSRQSRIKLQNQMFSKQNS